MYDVSMFRKLKQIYGGKFYTEGTEERIVQLEKELQITLPEDYKFFLRTLGEGFIYGMPYIYGINDKEKEGTLKETGSVRKLYGIDFHYVVIQKELEEETWICLETKEGNYEHCNVVEWSLKRKTAIVIAKSFDAYFNNLMKEEVQRIGRSFERDPKEKLEENPLFIGNEMGLHRIWNGEVKSLPRGVGYKRGWMVVQDAHITLEEVVEKFNYYSKEVTEYENGMEQVFSDQKCMGIYNMGQGEIYLSESLVPSFFYHKEELEKFSEGFEKVSLFFTHRVSETHGFTVVENGKIRRFYFCEESNFFPFRCVGEPLEEEKKLGLKLINGGNELETGWLDADGSRVKEDNIIELAMELTGRETEFCYEKIVVLKLGLLKE